MIVEVIHQGQANVSKKVLQEKLAKMYKVKDEKQVVVFGLKNAFGGGRSTGFALVYDSIEALKAFEPKFRLLRNGFGTKVNSSRKQRKERKNKAKYARGKKKKEIMKGGAAKK
jgi:small subunit ribosomal protein S24e